MAVELGHSLPFLETADEQLEAVSMYTILGYERVACSGRVPRTERSICFEKRLRLSLHDDHGVVLLERLQIHDLDDLETLFPKVVGSVMEDIARLPGHVLRASFDR